MGGKFVAWTREQVHEKMAEMGFEDVTPDGVGELIYERQGAREGHAIRICTGVRKGDGESRDVGKDAGRVLLLAGDRVIWSASRTHRTRGFLSNLHAKAREAWKVSAVAPLCPWCADDMALRKNKKTGQPFWGCSRFPTCKCTMTTAEVNAAYEEGRSDG